MWVNSCTFQAEFYRKERNQVTHSISVVIPVYNSALTLPTLIERLIPVLDQHAQMSEIILVNDCSCDESWEVISCLAQENPSVRGINLMRNYGQHNALLCGIRTAANDIIVTIDDDLQHPPEEISQLLAKLGEGYDVVYGLPLQEQHNLLRNIASRITKYALRSAMGISTAQQVSAFRAFRTEVRQGFADFDGPFVSVDVLLSWGTTRFTAVKVRHETRRLGKSNYTAVKLIKHALNMITGFSTLPLHLASAVGFAFTAFGICLLFFILGRLLIDGGSIPGFPFLASTIIIFAGVQLSVIGIIGEYLARMYQRIMEKPAYTVRHDTALIGLEKGNNHDQ